MNKPPTRDTATATATAPPSEPASILPMYSKGMVMPFKVLTLSMLRINLPARQPGSSIMPGKVNPVIPEVVNQTCFYVIGQDLTVTMAAEAGQLQLNVMEPVIAFAMFTSLDYLGNAIEGLVDKCIDGITANTDHCFNMVMNSIGIVTQLNPILGYEESASIAGEALKTGKSIHEIAVVERKLISQFKWDEIYSLENLITPKYINA